MSFICVGPIVPREYTFFGVSGFCSFKLSAAILEQGDHPTDTTDFLENYAAQMEHYTRNTIVECRHQILLYLFQKFRPPTQIISLANPTNQTIGEAKLNQIALGTVQVFILNSSIPQTILGHSKL